MENKQRDDRYVSPLQRRSASASGTSAGRSWVLTHPDSPESWPGDSDEDRDSPLGQDCKQESNNTTTRSSVQIDRKDERRSIYASLNVKGETIRLLFPQKVFKPQGDMSPIEDMSFAMTNASLNDPGIEFDALSYAWGSTKCTKKIKVNGMRVYVTDNLFDALTLLSRPGTLSRAIWIDAICIDQLNIPERNHQVSLMKQIYERAQQVHIVLGSGTADRTAIFDSARRLSTSIELQDLKRLGNAELRDLFICPWWTRLWVLQEVILAKIPVVHWGAESISFWALMEVMAAVRFAKIGSHSDDKKESRGGEQEQWLYNFDRAVYSFTVLRDPNTPPELVLSVSSNLEASDERDRVYGVLALMPALARIFPDYTLQARDIFQRTALEVMKQQQNLRLLRLIRTIEHSPPERRPSWVPSFGGLSGLIGEHIDVFGFTGNDVRVPFLLEETGTGGILVNAHVLEDSVKVVGPSCGLEYQRRNGCQSRQKDIQAHLRLTLRTWFELAAEEAKPHYICSNIDDCDSSVHSHRCVRTEFWKTILCDGLFDLVTGRELQNLSLTFKAYDGWLQAGGRDTRLSPYQHGELRLLAGSSTFFITKRGRMGLSRSNVQNGDVIALFAGETIPYILRPHSGTESKRYNIAGSCFCNGLMYGEAIEEILRFRPNEVAQSVLEDIYEEVELT